MQYLAAGLSAPSVEGQRTDTMRTACPVKCRDGVLSEAGAGQGTGALQDVGHQGKRAVPGNFLFIYGT